MVFDYYSHGNVHDALHRMNWRPSSCELLRIALDLGKGFAVIVPDLSTLADWTHSRSIPHVETRRCAAHHALNEFGPS